MGTAAERGTISDAIGREEQWLQERLEFHLQAQGLMEQELSDGRWMQIVERRTENGYIVGIRTDITERKQQEEQLRQAQKMEAVGQLAGGIAHDFNNLLAIIQGNMVYLDRQLEADSPYKALVAPTLRAAKRGAALTHRLLAFSRRQPLDVQDVRVEELLAGMQDLLHRSLGEDIGLDLVNPGEALWACLVDPVQLEQAILNLAINARDAMPRGGMLIVTTENTTLLDEQAAQAEVAPGDYLTITVTDTGEGIPNEVMERIFEPFYTTKDVGKGSGLGLSMVFGFAKQSGGHLTAYSEVGLGSSFRLYLPRAVAKHATKPAEATAVTAAAIPRGKGETILVVEDDADVRWMAAMLLEEYGYRVRQAETGATAMAILEEGTEIGLLLTDVVLPGGMSGPKLADFARRQQPALKVLFMSGHARDEIAEADDFDPGIELLQKPFEPADLARSIATLIAPG